MDWHTLSETSNVLSIVGILVSALGVLISIFYARSAKKTAKTALEAARAARNELLLRIAADEFEECLEHAGSIRLMVHQGAASDALEVIAKLAGSLAEAKASWPDLLKELQLEEIGLALRETERITPLLRDETLRLEERTEQALQRIDLVNRLLRQIRGKLRYRS